MTNVLAFRAPSKPEGTTIYAVANRIIAYGRVLTGPDQPAMTARRINRLAYLAYGQYARDHGRALCASAPEAWAAGPAFGALVYALHTYGDAPVTGEIVGPYGIELLPPGEARTLIDRVCVEWDGVSDAALAEGIARHRAWRHTLAEFGEGAPIAFEPIQRDFLDA